MVYRAKAITWGGATAYDIKVYMKCLKSLQQSKTEGLSQNLYLSTIFSKIMGVAYFNLF